LEYCAKRHAFFIIDSPRDYASPGQVIDALASGGIPRSPNAAVYFPWIRIADPLRHNQLRTTPPSGAVAGLIARLDAARGVWKAARGHRRHGPRRAGANA
jgi:phage tail sheath protein FI